jgi:hippurate hydrolase
VALRGDIDALPIEEATGLPFASQVPGAMHACGHDAHATWAVAAAALLAVSGVTRLVEFWITNGTGGVT